MSLPLKPALFLDRDGVINVDHGYVCSPERTDFIPGIFELCRDVRACGYLIVVVTNQAGIARGYYTEAQFHAYMSWMRQQFARRGAGIDAVYHCPHHPEASGSALRLRCECRKPRPGMLLQAQRELGIDMAASTMLGDKVTDMQAADAARVGRCLLLGAPDGDHGGYDRIPDLESARARILG